MRVRHLIVAAAASVAFAVTPALAKQVLVRGPPEIICEGIQSIDDRGEGHTIVRTVSCDGGSATIRYMADLDPDRPNKHPFAPSGYWEHTLTVTDGSAKLESEIRAPRTRYVYRVLSASVQFTRPPARIPLDRGSGVAEVRATMTCSGKNVGNVRDGPHLSIGSPSLYTSFAPTGTRERDPGGFERDVFEAVCSGDEARHEFNVSHRTAEIRIRFSTGTGGTHLIPLGRETGVSIRYPYTLEEEPDEPEVAGGEGSDCLDYRRVIHDHHQAIQAASAEYATMAGYMEDYDRSTRVNLCTSDLDHFSQIGILTFDDSWSGVLSNANTTVGYLAKIPALGTVVGQIGKGLGALTTFVRVLESERLPVDEAFSVYQEIQAERRAVADLLRHGIGLYYCRQIFPDDRELYRLYHETIPNSNICSAADKSALLGDIVRNRPVGLPAIWLDHIFQANLEMCSTPAAQ